LDVISIFDGADDIYARLGDVIPGSAAQGAGQSDGAVGAIVSGGEQATVWVSFGLQGSRQVISIRKSVGSAAGGLIALQDAAEGSY